MKTGLRFALLSASLSLAAGGCQAQARDGALHWNVAVVNDYRFRGISQSRLSPALQGGVDYTAAHGWYAGVWASTIGWLKDAGATSGSVEVDLNLGRQWTDGQATWDLGLARYGFVGNNLHRRGQREDPSTTEAYAAYSVADVTFKYSHVLTRWMGNPNSQNSHYTELSKDWALPDGWTLRPHLGHLRVRNTAPSASYADYAVTVSRKWMPGLSFSASVQGTNADRSVYTTAQGRFTGGAGLVLGLQYAR